MIQLNVKKVKSIIEILANIQNYSSRLHFVQSLMPTLNNLHNCKCPMCGSIDKFHSHCTYERNISFVLNDDVVNFRVTVTRVICDSCESTHALLPDFIVPYKIFSSCSICRIVNDAISSSVLAVAHKLSVSYQLIYYYISLYLSFFPNVSILNNANNYCHTFNETIYLEDFLSFCCDSKFRHEHFIFFKWIFLMSKFRNSNYNSIYIGVA